MTAIVKNVRVLFQIPNNTETKLRQARAHTVLLKFKIDIEPSGTKSPVAKYQLGLPLASGF